MEKLKNFRQLERLVRGFANHRRIQIVELLDREPELLVIEIAGRLNINFKTAAEHVRRLALAGIVMKRSDGASVRHKLTRMGSYILKFLRTLE
mgnify:CR=1 FL=1